MAEGEGAKPQTVLELPQRPEPPLSPEALVVRGGEMLPEDLKRSAVKVLMMYGVLGFSVVVGEFDLEELCYRARQGLKVFSTIHYCRVKNLDSRLFELLPTFSAPHYTLIVPSVEDIHLQRLKRRFTRADNPVAKRKGGR
jgi:hypothetical protein